MVDWDQVLGDALTAVKNSLGGVFTTATHGAAAQVEALVNTAKYIAENQSKMTPDEDKYLLAQQKMAMQNVLTTYEAIGIAAAQNAIASVLDVIVRAVPGLKGIV